MNMHRRRLIELGLGGAVAFGTSLKLPVRRAHAAPTMVDDAVIDLMVEPVTLDPANVYDADGWSIVHSIYDSLVQFNADGEVVPLLATSLVQVDPLTWEVGLRDDIAFHNGEPFDAKSVIFSVAHIVDPETKSQVAWNFSVIKEVEEVEPHLVRFHLSAPAPWLPSQIAPWLAMLPPVYAADPANDFASNPVGTGPYKFVSWDRGVQVVVEANEAYPADSPKGVAFAKRASFRPVPTPSTEVADLLSGSATVIRTVPVDQISAVNDSGASVVSRPLSGVSFIRIPTDQAPFDDPRVRQAMNYAVDVDGIVAALLNGQGQRLSGLFPEGALGYNADLKPFPFDLATAKALLEEAGLSKGFETRLAYATSERKDIVEAIAGQLAVVGIMATVEAVEVATFNQTWKDPESAPLRFVSWRPMFDPFTLLSLMFSAEGFLSRYNDPAAQALITAGAAEADPAARQATYQELGQVLRDSPGGIYLYQLSSFYGVAKDAPAWTPRPDDYIIPTTVLAR